MTVAYVETSAAAKLIIDENESAGLAAWLSRDDLVVQGTFLVETELRRLAHRENVAQERVAELLDRYTLFELSSSLLREAGLLVGKALRPLDAIHLAAALRLGVDVLVTYDERLAEAAVAYGLRTLAPA